MTSPCLTGATGRVPRGLIGMIGLVVLVESLIAWHSLDFTRFYIHDWRVSGQSARLHARDRSVLCFGDSQVKFGILPRTIQKQTGQQAYNLAVCGGQASSSYVLLKRAINAKAKPATIVVDFAAHLLSTGPRHNLRQWPELLAPAEAVELGLVNRHAGFCAELALGYLFPSIRSRDEIRGNILATTRGKVGSRRADVIVHRQIWAKNLGAEIHPERPNYQGEIEPDNRAYFPRRWSSHPVNLHYVYRFLDLAKANDIKVVWLLPPVVPKFQARSDELGLERQYDSLLNSMVDKYHNLSILDGRYSGYDHSRFVDPLHLSRSGAEVFSSQVAHAIATESGKRDSSSRWVSLPDLRTDAEADPERTAYLAVPTSSVALCLPGKGCGR